MTRYFAWCGVGARSHVEQRFFRDSLDVAANPRNTGWGRLGFRRGSGRFGGEEIVAVGAAAECCELH
jgi:hypothetical protein